MDAKTGFFYLFSVVLLFAAFRVITARNPVHAVLYLILAFSQAAAVWLLLKAEFLAIALVLVYLGAVMVLFLFVVMMLDIRMDALRQGVKTYLPLGLAIGLVMVLEMAFVLGRTWFGRRGGCSGELARARPDARRSEYGRPGRGVSTPDRRGAAGAVRRRIGAMSHCSHLQVAR